MNTIAQGVRTPQTRTSHFASSVLGLIALTACDEFTCADYATCPIESEAGSTNADASLTTDASDVRSNTGSNTASTSAQVSRETDKGELSLSIDASIPAPPPHDASSLPARDASQAETDPKPRTEHRLDAGTAGHDGLFDASQSPSVGSDSEALDAEAHVTSSTASTSESPTTTGQQSPLANGAGCTTPDQCESNFCADGVCCDAACDGVCEACSENGECSVTSDDDACATITCQPSSACVSYPGPNTSARCDSSGGCVASEDYCQPTLAEVGTPCGTGLSCNPGGACVSVCSEAELWCDGECVDPSSHPDFCGATDDCDGRNAGDTCAISSERCISRSCRSWKNELTFGISGQTHAASTCVMSRNGNAAVVVWNARDETYQVYASHWNGTAWAPTPALSNTSLGAAYSGNVALSEDGSIGAVGWYQSNENTREAYLGRYAGGTWSRTKVSTGHVQSQAPRVGLSSDGSTALAVWAEYNGETDEMRASEWTNGAWSPSVTISSGIATAAATIDLALSTDGMRAMAAWRQTGGLYVNLWSKSAGWEGASLLVNGTSAANPRVAVASNGRGAVTWQQSQSGAIARIYDQGWADPVQVSGDGEVVSVPLVAANADGSQMRFAWSSPLGTGTRLLGNGAFGDIAYLQGSAQGSFDISSASSSGVSHVVFQDSNQAIFSAVTTGDSFATPLPLSANEAGLNPIISTSASGARTIACWYDVGDTNIKARVFQ